MKVGEWILELDPASKPQTIVVELGTLCNLACRHCFLNTLREPRGYMDRKTFARIVDEIRRLGIRRVVFTGFGEPTIHPDFLDFLKTLKEIGVEIVINTNGHTLRDYAKHFVDLGIDEIAVSIDSFDNDRYREIRGSDLGNVLEGLDLVNKLRRERGAKNPTISVYMVLTKKNLVDLDAIPSFVSRYLISKVVVTNIVPLSEEMEREFACYIDPECIETVERARDELSRVFFSSYTSIEIASTRPRIERRCPYIHNQALFVRWDGGVAPCMFFAHRLRICLKSVERNVNPVILGSIDEGLSKLWRSRSWIELRFRVFFNHLPSCLDCDLAPYCEPTQSNDYDCWGNSPTCAFCPYLHRLAVCPI